jgi:hypothetical protein
MLPMHVSAGLNARPISEMLPISKPIHTECSIQTQKHGKVESFQQGITPATDRSRQYPVLYTLYIAQDHPNSFLRVSLVGKGWISVFPVIGIRIQVFSVDTECEFPAQGGGTRP